MSKYGPQNMWRPGMVFFGVVHHLDFHLSIFDIYSAPQPPAERHLPAKVPAGRNPEPPPPVAASSHSWASCAANKHVQICTPDPKRPNPYCRRLCRWDQVQSLVPAVSHPKRSCQTFAQSIGRFTLSSFRVSYQFPPRICIVAAEAVRVLRVISDHIHDFVLTFTCIRQLTVVPL